MFFESQLTTKKLKLPSVTDSREKDRTYHVIDDCNTNDVFTKEKSKYKKYNYYLF